MTAQTPIYTPLAHTRHRKGRKKYIQSVHGPNLQGEAWKCKDSIKVSLYPSTLTMLECSAGSSILKYFLYPKLMSDSQYLLKTSEDCIKLISVGLLI